MYSGKELGMEGSASLYWAESSCVGLDHSSPSRWTVVSTRQHRGDSVTYLSELAGRGVRDGEIWFRAGGSKSQNMCSLFQTSCRPPYFLEFGISSMFLDISR